MYEKMFNNTILFYITSELKLFVYHYADILKDKSMILKIFIFIRFC